MEISPFLHITKYKGLDPAGPLFEDMDEGVRLDASHAQFVDVIHTSQILGINRAIGHVDTFVNGGHDQSGCSGTYRRTSGGKGKRWGII